MSMDEGAVPRRTRLLIIGAGPFGLGMARYAVAHRIDHLIVGRPMEFWRGNMPEGMLLRSGPDWHLDALGELTIERFLGERSLDTEAAMPLSLDLYLDYGEWFRKRAGIEVREARVVGLALEEGDTGRFATTFDDGQTVVSDAVLLAVGFRYFVHEPPELLEILPRDRTAHTCTLVELAPLRGKRCLIVGGRQSAFEWAALLAEAGAAEVHLVHRHRSPELAESDWSWVAEMVDRLAEDPGWYRRLPEDERRAVDRRFWEEGRLKVEPWLAARLPQEVVRVWPETEITGCHQGRDGALRIHLGPTGRHADVDRVILATGYKVDMERLPFLDADLRRRMETADGFPVLDETFQTTVPGLYATSMPATRDFGAFLAFTVSVRAATQVVGAAIRRRADAG